MLEPVSTYKWRRDMLNVIVYIAAVVLLIGFAAHLAGILIHPLLLVALGLFVFGLIMDRRKAIV